MLGLGKDKKGLFHCMVFVKIIDSSKKLRNHQTEGPVVDQVRHFRYVNRAYSKY